MLGYRLLTAQLVILLYQLLQVKSFSSFDSNKGFTKMSSFQEKKLEPLILTCKQACDVMAPMILGFYNAITGDTAKLKADASVFTIADGIVQHLLINHLFAGGKFNEVVGEEDDSNVNISLRPFTVDDLVVPVEFFDTIENVRDAVTALGSQIDVGHFKDLSIFIDPIDGTREFSTSLGEQCSVCIGFSDIHGKPVAGLVYRPLTQPPTWAAGAKAEDLVLGHLDKAAEPNPRGLLTSNGGISPFIVELMKELDFVRVPSGGAGNKMLMLLEGKGGAYIQDRGVSRWDTSGAQAVIEAYGGVLGKLTAFEASKSIESYTYLKSPVNLDFEPGVASLTPFNAVDKTAVKKGETRPATDVTMVKPYANLCGLLAVDSACIPQLDSIYEAIQRAKLVAPPAYD